MLERGGGIGKKVGASGGLLRLASGKATPPRCKGWPIGSGLASADL